MDARLKGRRLAAVLAYWQMGRYDARRGYGRWAGPYGATLARTEAAYARYATKKEV